MLRPYVVINRVFRLTWDLGKYLGRGEAFRRIIYGKKLEIYDRNASPLFVRQRRNRVSGFLGEAFRQLILGFDR